MATIYERIEGEPGAAQRLTHQWDMEYMTVTAKADGRRYIAIFRKWFNERLGAWELEMVPGTMRWLD
ncbi:MAG TPA: hypothetical protein VKA60_04815 [Blastocatellia bacterium]|nr:hypothetical protein [Blastocatellia bacterium]